MLVPLLPLHEPRRPQGRTRLVHPVRARGDNHPPRLLYHSLEPFAAHEGEPGEVVVEVFGRNSVEELDPTREIRMIPIDVLDVVDPIVHVLSFCELDEWYLPGFAERPVALGGVGWITPGVCRAPWTARRTDR